MNKTTIIFGNGLGMALDKEHFDLTKALQKTWNNQFILNPIQKEQILQCLKMQGINDFPHGEEHFDILHQASMACSLLRGLESDNRKWLTVEGKNFPSATNKFITAVAWNFFRYNKELPNKYLGELNNYIIKYKANIATLNYDNLLYKNFIENKILCGYDNCLVDGFHCNETRKFKPENLERKFNHDFGYYLHLHGSPLFIGDRDNPEKQLLGSLDFNKSSQHLVLSDFKHKPSIIANSFLLRTYWQYFQIALRESEKIFVVGYSGSDMHLNKMVKENISNKKIIVVEWNGSTVYKERLGYWKNALTDNTAKLELIQLPNILEYTNWENE